MLLLQPIGPPPLIVVSSFVVSSSVVSEQYEHGDKIDDIQRSYAPVLDAQTQQPLPAAITGRSAFINEKSCKFDAIFYDLKQSSAGAPRQPINSGTQSIDYQSCSL